MKSTVPTPTEQGYEAYCRALGVEPKEARDASLVGSLAKRLVRMDERMEKES